MHKPMDADTLRRERLAYRYVRALDRGDLEDVEAVLEAAMDDPLLSHALSEIDLAYQDELSLVPAPADVRLVRELLRKHFNSAGSDEAEEELAEEPLTVSDVAVRLQHEKRVPAGDREANRRLLGSHLVVPGFLNLEAVRQLARETGVEASERFWRLFRETAIMLGIGRSHQQSQMAAAREQRHKSQAAKPPSQLRSQCEEIQE
ncbi:MAG: hypothetical protein ACK47B_12610 [Armatimonadota bacterium]